MWYNKNFPKKLQKEVISLVAVYLEEGDTLEKALKKFRRLVEQEQIITEAKRRMYYEKPSEKRKRKMRAARKRLLKQLKKQKYLL